MEAQPDATIIQSTNRPKQPVQALSPCPHLTPLMPRSTQRHLWLTSFKESQLPATMFRHHQQQLHNVIRCTHTHFDRLKKAPNLHLSVPDSPLNVVPVCNARHLTRLDCHQDQIHRLTQRRQTV
eukprot:3001672-Amphidinium_carterae.1